MNQNTANAIAASVAALTESLRAERDALRAEVEMLRAKLTAAESERDGLRRECVPMTVPSADGFRRVGGRRLLRAAQSLHRAWRREREGGERLRAFVASLRADGLDIDDPDTAPTWTGKIHVDGRLVFDLAAVEGPEAIPYSALCHHQTRPDCAGCPDDAVCEASGRAPRQ